MYKKLIYLNMNTEWESTNFKTNSWNTIQQENGGHQLNPSVVTLCTTCCNIKKILKVYLVHLRGAFGRRHLIGNIQDYDEIFP